MKLELELEVGKVYWASLSSLEDAVEDREEVEYVGDSKTHNLFRCMTSNYIRSYPYIVEIEKALISPWSIETIPKPLPVVRPRVQTGAITQIACASLEGVYLGDSFYTYDDALNVLEVINPDNTTSPCGVVLSGEDQ